MLVVQRVFRAKRTNLHEKYDHPIPPLYNVTLAGTSSEAWVLRGFERIESGPMRRPCLLGQTWVVEPAAVQELIDAETKWGNEVRLANELREQVRLLTQAEKPSASQSAG